MKYRGALFLFMELIKEYEKYLRENKYNFEVDDYGDIFYCIYQGSIACFVMLEISDDDEVVAAQYYIRLNKDSYCELYNLETDWDKYELKDIIEYTEQLLQKGKELNSAINKIRNRIEQIREIMEDNDLVFEEFITIHFDFDE